MAREKVRKQFALSSAKNDGKYVTRDGRKVIRWRLIHDPEQSLWPVEVTVEEPHSRGSVKYVVNQNGRRYANVRSVDDIYEASPWPYDCMPNPIDAIQYARTKQYSRIKAANKETATYWKQGDTAIVPNLEIGEL